MPKGVEHLTETEGSSLRLTNSRFAVGGADIASYVVLALDCLDEGFQIRRREKRIGSLFLLWNEKLGMVTMRGDREVPAGACERDFQRGRLRRNPACLCDCASGTVVIR